MMMILSDNYCDVYYNDKMLFLHMNIATGKMILMTLTIITMVLMTVIKILITTIYIIHICIF